MKKKNIVIIVLSLIVVIGCVFLIKRNLERTPVHYDEIKVNINGENYDYDYDRSYEYKIKEDTVTYNVKDNEKQIVLLIPQGDPFIKWVPQKEVKGLELVESGKVIDNEFPKNVAGGTDVIQKFVYDIKNKSYESIILQQVNILQFDDPKDFHKKNMTFDEVEPCFELKIELK